MAICLLETALSQLQIAPPEIPVVLINQLNDSTTDTLSCLDKTLALFEKNPKFSIDLRDLSVLMKGIVELIEKIHPHAAQDLDLLAKLKKLPPALSDLKWSFSFSSKAITRYNAAVFTLSDDILRYTEVIAKIFSLKKDPAPAVRKRLIDVYTTSTIKPCDFPKGHSLQKSTTIAAIYRKILRHEIIRLSSSQA